MSRKVTAISFQRYNGGVRIKRQWGSSTVTRFYVFYTDERNDTSKTMVFEGFWKTPGERKSYAINLFRKAHGESVPDLASIQNIIK